SGGFTPLHLKLEKQLCEFTGKPAGIIFPTGYTANLGAIAALCSVKDTIYVDREVHASIIDGCRLSGARLRFFAHNDTSDLSRLIQESTSGNKLVVIESVYSMGGPDADIVSFVKVAHQYGALIMVDESHAFGFYGERGAGLSEAKGVLREVDIFMCTLSKSLASIGGFIGGSKEIIDLIKNSSRAFIFQACSTPASVAAALAALELVKKSIDREKLWLNTNYFREKISQFGFLSSGTSPIVPIYCATASGAWTASQILLEKGVYTPPIVYPAVPVDESRLRFTITSTHTKDQIDKTISALNEVRHFIFDKNIQFSTGFPLEIDVKSVDPKILADCLRNAADDFDVEVACAADWVHFYCKRGRFNNNSYALDCDYKFSVKLSSVNENIFFSNLSFLINLLEGNIKFSGALIDLSEFFNILSKLKRLS
ncbi:MAG: aminotransferase class I/II-fold pyridoxal phosphate-dependent enzyme, partial [Hydrogenophaga sp.]|uniref:aminotransferase class I/II-fold pyridoxal phosphate-dependent enzyme n=1 Tax=Hydrogenophaga sp. TaxID=1904254 RepID=UPI002ABCCAF4